MRLIAISIVVLAAGIMTAADALPKTRGIAGDLGPFCVVAGLIALGIELYLTPIIPRRFPKRGD